MVFANSYFTQLGFPGGTVVKKPMQEMQETCVRSLGWEDPLEKYSATQSSSLAWRISWTEEPADGLYTL